MILKLKKTIYNGSEEYLLQSWLGDFLCKILPLPGGYYLYNKEGNQLGQITFGKQEARLSALSVRPGFPGALSISGKEGNFRFYAPALSKEDKKYLQNVEEKKVPAYSVWGSVKNYAYDLYEGGTILANVAPAQSDPSLFSVNLHPEANFIWTVMILLALEKLA